MACEKFKIALPPGSSKSASLEWYTGELEKRVRSLIPASSRCELRRLKLTSSHAFLVRQGAFSSFSVNVKSISASSAEIRVHDSSKAEGWIMDFVAIPGLVCALAAFLILYSLAWLIGPASFHCSRIPFRWRRRIPGIGRLPGSGFPPEVGHHVCRSLIS